MEAWVSRRSQTGETMSTTENTTHRTGRIALIGRPNAGKSTLLNQVLGQKLAIVSSKPQTTRNRIMGVYNAPDLQAILLDISKVVIYQEELPRRCGCFQRPHPGVVRGSNGVIPKEPPERGRGGISPADVLLFVNGGVPSSHHG